MFRNTKLQSILKTLAPAMGVIFTTVLNQSQAFAQAAAPAGQQPSPLMSFIPIIFMVAVMWFLMIRPQMKKQKELASFVSSIQRGDEVVTTSGILGRIEGLTDTHVTLEIAPQVRIKILRSAIAGSSKAITNGNSSEVKA